MPFLKNRRRKSSAIDRHPVISKLLILLVLCLVLLACWNIGSKDAYQQVHKVPVSEDEQKAAFPLLAFSNLDHETKPKSDAKWIDLSKEEEHLTITEEGDYILTGKLKGSLSIDARDAVIHIFLNNAEIESDQGPAIIVDEAQKIVITLLDGTENEITDSGDYRESKDYDACIYSDCDLTFNGPGKLEVYGLYKDAIRTKDILRVAEGNYRIHCKRSGLYGNDGIHIAGGSLFIGSEKYGLKTTKSGAEGKGNLVVAGGDLSIVAGRHSFVVEKAMLYIFNCTVQMKSVVSDYDVKGSKVIDNGCIQ